MTTLPNWVYDLIEAVRVFEEDHPKVENGRDCLIGALNKVPSHYIETAKTIAEYRSQNETKSIQA